MILIRSKKRKVKKWAAVVLKWHRCCLTSTTITRDRCRSTRVSLQRFRLIVALADANRLTVCRLSRPQLPNKFKRSLGAKLQFWPRLARLGRTWPNKIPSESATATILGSREAPPKHIRAHLRPIRACHLRRLSRCRIDRQGSPPLKIPPLRPWLESPVRC